MSVATPYRTERPLGQAALYEMLEMSGPSPYVRSYVGRRRYTQQSESHVDEVYPAVYATESSIEANLRFAFRHEALDLRIVNHALNALGADGIADWVRAKPTGGSSRRAWFFFELLNNETIDIEPATRGSYESALDPNRHVAARPIKSGRHRILDNLLGDRNFCPVVRRSVRIQKLRGADLGDRANALVDQYPVETLARAVVFLYTKETRTSFAIESEQPSRSREERFIQALIHAAEFDHDSKEAFVRLQASLVDPRYAATDWRTIQNFVGRVNRRWDDAVEYICPRPADVPRLMDGWMRMTDRLIDDTVDPIVAAAVSAFAFVFVHPFEDGNGRIHRFLIHHVLARKRFGAPGLIFPVSAAILRQRHLYDRALESFSKPTIAAIDWAFDQNQIIEVRNDTLDLYRFFDATAFVEFLYDRVAETIETDLKDELEFLRAFDLAMQGIRAIVDMPDKRAVQLIRYCVQNDGRLSNNKRSQFPELTDDEIAQIEAVTRRAINEGQFRPDAGE